MSFLSGFAGGMAKGASSYMDDMQDEEDAQRKRVDANIFSTTNTMFQNAVVVRDKRQKEIKDNKAYANLLSSKDESIAKDPAKMAYVLSLPEEARQDILKLTDSDIFRTNNIPLVDYFEAIDDPIEYKDPVTLTERVRGKVIDRPLEASQYYGVSTTKDKEVDKIVAGYAGGFATAYGMSADHAQGLLDSATQEVKMQRFKINWANKKRMSAQDDAFNVAKIASSNMGMEKDSQQIAAILDTQNSNSMGKAFTSWASGEGVPPNMIETDPALPARFKASNAYGIAREEVIKQMARDMIEAPNRMLDRSTKLFFAREYPGYWGGNANETPKEDIKRAAYYEITSNGKVEVLRGIDILRKIKAAANKNGTKPETSITETDSILAAAIIKDESLRQDTQTNLVETQTNPVETPKSVQLSTELENLKISGVKVEELGFKTWAEAQANIDENEADGKGGIKGGITREDDVVRMNNEMRTAKGSYRKYLLQKLGDDYIEAPTETKETPIRELTPYQKVMMDEKRGTIGAAKAYDQAVDIAIQNGDMAAIRRVQSIIAGLTGDDIGLGVSDMLEELTAKIESALNK